MSNIDVSTLLARVEKRLLIDGTWRDGSEGETFDVVNPATGKVITSVASASRTDAVSALAAAHRARASWEKTTPRERADLLRKAYDLTLERKEEFAPLMSLEMGKTYAQALGEVDYGADYLLWFSEEANHFFGSTNHYPAKGARMLTFRKPVGPCLLITPWNFPLSMGTRKVAPALAAGNTVIIKPSGKTPLTIQYFVQTLIDAGVPAGVVNLVPTASSRDVSEPLLADPRLRKVSFTGSTKVGATLLKQAADNILRTSMELGGNAPAIVCADADLDVAVEGVTMAKMRNNAEACTAANRIFVHESVADEFTEKFVAAIKGMRVDEPFAEGVDLGPLIDGGAVEHMQELVADAKAHGADVLCGGHAVDRDGYFFEPTVLRGCSTEARVYQEEIFGPIAPIFTFRDEEELWGLANDTEYGLASYVFSQDPNMLHRASDNLEFGIIGFNTGAVSDASIPFGGMKASGLGREGSKEGMLEYTELQFVGMPDPYEA
ncbi:NAD-dependent succinate-semialdehyde dehydrogenase [Corynebacterium meitnerae]|uniref:NAD-dependent succinate-semialdehyde dehydrogenase n=1 Tax=Corynebacterium meitnerae TaxID=2913498 RepID=A0A9X3LT10_9CORY|nr:NAD-dependent succinate-semialdehyde dehydrogenase [Corynebacterium meitnerae]MCZ9293711.1 NAD-dependent succinate-semialdehyde dehydrogenase [Corynebacterium meitnerae]